VKTSDVKLWMANTAIRSLIGEKKVWLVVPEEVLNNLAYEHPANYLGILSDWRKALFDQVYYCYENGVLDILCATSQDGVARFFDFKCKVADDCIEIAQAGYYGGEAKNWVAIKKQGRIIRGH